MRQLLYRNKLSNNLTKLIVFLLLFILIDRFINMVLVSGLSKYYGLNSDSKVALLGHSHLMLGLDHLQIEKALGTKVAKYTREGVNVSDRFVMIKQLVNRNPKTKLIIYGVDAEQFTGEGLSKNSYKLFYPFFGDPNIQNYIRNNENDHFAYLQHLLISTTRFDEGLFFGALRGYLGKWDNLKYGIVDTSILKKNITLGNYRKIKFEHENLETFYKTLDYLEEKNIHVILLFIPTIDLYNNTQPEEFGIAKRIFKECEKKYTNLEYYDYTEPWSHDYSIFYDPIHLNPKGQKLITNKLILELKNHYFNLK